MTDTDYLNAAEHLLQTIEANCDRINDTTNADIDNQRVGGMITLSFANKSQIIINLQKPLHEVWMAARAGGYHYKLSSATHDWRCTRENTEFFSDLSRHASSQAAQALSFSAEI
jgi:CyaY protein